MSVCPARRVRLATSTAAVRLKAAVTGMSLLGRSWRALELAEISLLQTAAAAHLGGRPAAADLARIQQIGSVRHRKRKPRHLIDQQDRRAFVAKLGERRVELLNERGREPERGLVQH